MTAVVAMLVVVVLMMGICRFAIKVLEPSLQGTGTGGHCRIIILLGGSRKTPPAAVLRATCRGCWRQ